MAPTFGHLSQEDLISRLMSEHIGGGELEKNTAKILKRLGAQAPASKQPDVWINVPGRGSTPPKPGTATTPGSSGDETPPVAAASAPGFFGGMWESMKRNPEAWIRLAGQLGGPTFRGPAAAVAGAVEIGSGGGRSQEYQRILSKQAVLEEKQKRGEAITDKDRLTNEERVVLARGGPRDPAAVATEAHREMEAAEQAANPPLPEVRMPQLPSGMLSRGAGAPLVAQQPMESPLAMIGQRRFSMMNPFARNLSGLPNVGK